MWPLVWSGARLAIETCEMDALLPGDLAVVRSEIGVIVHRVIDDGGVLRTRGDWTSVHDAPLTRERLLGRVRGFALGRWTLPTPRWLTARLNQGALVLRPLVDRARTRSVIVRLRRGRDLLARSPIGTLVRGRGEIVVRVLGPADERALRRTTWSRGRYARSLHEELRELASDGCVLGALAGERLIGQIVLRPSPDDPPVLTAWDFWVDPWFRGRGIGRALAELALREAGARRARELRVLVMPESRSHMLFRHLGFAEIEASGEAITLGRRDL
jgi:ribosomal protein S18 acetylase RimI-like enzyme